MPSFDVSSSVNPQEVKNAVEQVRKELTTRFDLKDANCSIEYKEKEALIILAVPDKMKLQSVSDLTGQKLAKRGVSLKSVEFCEPTPAGGDTLRQEVKIKQTLTPEDLKRLSKHIKESGIKVSAQIQGDELRVSGKKRDDLQTAIASLRTSITDLSLQFGNFRE